MRCIPPNQAPDVDIVEVQREPSGVTMDTEVQFTVTYVFDGADIPDRGVLARKLKYWLEQGRFEGLLSPDIEDGPVLFSVSVQE